MHQVELQAPGWAPLFWRNLNVFIAAFTLIVSLAGFVIFVPVSLLAKLVLPSGQAEAFAYPLGYALVALALIYWWSKKGLSPRQRDPAREWRFRWGHVLLAVCNVGILAVFGLSALGSYLPRMPAAAALLLVLVGMAPCLGQRAAPDPARFSHPGPGSD